MHHTGPENHIHTNQIQQIRSYLPYFRQVCPRHLLPFEEAALPLLRKGSRCYIYPNMTQVSSLACKKTAQPVVCSVRAALLICLKTCMCCGP